MTAATGGSSSSSSTPDMLLQRLSENVQKQPSKILFSYIVPGSTGGGSGSTFGGKISRQLTYEQVDNETTQLGQQLLVDYGLSKGDRYVL